MSKEELRSGLEGWIRDTRKAAASLRQDRDADRLDLERLRQVARKGSSEELDELAGRVAGELDELGQAVEILNAASTRLSPARRRQLDEGLAKLAPEPPPPAPPPPAALPKRQETPPDDSGIPRIAPSSFAAEVLESDVPVLVNVAVEGYPPCREAAALLESARRIYGGDVKVCAVDLLETGDDELPQMLKIGKGFLVKNLPAVLVFWGGRKIGEASGAVDPESLADLLRGEVGG